MRSMRRSTPPKAIRARRSSRFARSSALGSPKAGTFGAHGEPLGAENVKKTKEALGLADGARVLRAGRRARMVARSSARKALPYRAANGTRRTLLGKRRIRTSPHSSSARATKSCPDASRGRRSTLKTGSVATREAGGTVMNAIAKERCPNSSAVRPISIRRRRRISKAWATFSRADYAGRNIHFGVREHAMGAMSNGIAVHSGLVPFTATFFNFYDYMKPAMRLGRHSTRRAACSSSRTIRYSSAKTARRISRSNNSRCPASDAQRHDDPAGRLARDARSVEIRDRAQGSDGARAFASEVAISRRSRDDAVDSWRLRRSRRRRDQARSHLDRDGLGGLARARRGEDSIEAKGTTTRRRLDAFDGAVSSQQDDAYREQHPADRRPRTRLDRSGCDVRLASLRRRRAALRSASTISELRHRRIRYREKLRLHAGGRRENGRRSVDERIRRSIQRG